MDMNGENKGGEKSGGQEWRWCLVGNIAGAHEFGEEHEIRYGTKHFSPGTKVYLYPNFGGMANEYIVAVGIPRNGGKFIEVVIRTKYVENFRCKKVFKPAVLKRMDNSKYCYWWGNSEEDRERIEDFAKAFNDPSYFEENTSVPQKLCSEGMAAVGRKEENPRLQQKPEKRDDFGDLYDKFIEKIGRFFSSLLPFVLLIINLVNFTNDLM